MPPVSKVFQMWRHLQIHRSCLPGRHPQSGHRMRGPEGPPDFPLSGAPSLPGATSRSTTVDAASLSPNLVFIDRLCLNFAAGLQCKKSGVAALAQDSLETDAAILRCGRACSARRHLYLSHSAELAEPCVGGRVIVPFREKRLSGIVTELHDREPSFTAKPVIQVLDTAARASPLS